MSAPQDRPAVDPEVKDMAEAGSTRSRYKENVDVWNG